MNLAEVYAMRKEKNVAGLLDALCDSEECIRKAAAVYLGRIRDARAEEALGRLKFDDPIADVRQAAARAHETLVAGMRESPGER